MLQTQGQLIVLVCPTTLVARAGKYPLIWQPHQTSGSQGTVTHSIWPLLFACVFQAGRWKQILFYMILCIAPSTGFHVFQNDLHSVYSDRCCACQGSYTQERLGADLFLSTSGQYATCFLYQCALAFAIVSFTEVEFQNDKQSIMYCLGHTRRLVVCNKSPLLWATNFQMPSYHLM